MTEHAAETVIPQAWVVPMRGRSPQEAHRAATPLELLFDLVFVVAVTQAAAGLHHAIAENHVLPAIVSYTMVFFAIWWAWMNFTWFASAYDTDDILYRLSVLVQLVGALILAAGVPAAFAQTDFRIITVGYLVMRTTLIGQWLRAAHDDAPHRATAIRYVVGLALLEVGWVALLAVPGSARYAGFLTLVILELLVPVWAEQTNMTAWHPGHIAERYGLFTIIVLGESILSASAAIQSVIAAGTFNLGLIETIVGGILIIFGMWWRYFERPADAILTSPRTAFVWGYGHLLIFAAAAAVGAGLAVEIDFATGHTAIGPVLAGAAVAVPVVLYLLCLWFLHQRPRAIHGWEFALAPLTATLILLTPFIGHAALLTGVLLAALLAVKLGKGLRGTRQGA